MPATFFSKPLHKTIKTSSDKSTSYYPFTDYSNPSAPIQSELMICRNELAKTTTITTPRLLLKSFNQISKSELVEGLKDIFTDEKNVQLYWNGKPWSEEQINEYVEKYSANWDQGKKFSVYAIYALANLEKIIGTLDLCEDYTFANLQNTVGLGYIIAQSEKGKKIGREIGEIAWQEFVHEIATHSVKQLPNIGLAATAHPNNLASMTILTHILGDPIPNIRLNYGLNQPRNVFFRSYSSSLPYEKKITEKPEFV